MFFTQCFLFLLLVLICELINTTHQNDLSLLTNNYTPRIKRFVFGKFFKPKSNSQTRSKYNQEEDILLDGNLYVSDNNEEELQSESKEEYTQQELSEINRILSRKENDYYGILGIDTKATPDIIESTHKKLISRVHPDKFDVLGATEATQRLNKARDALLEKFKNQNQNNKQQTTKMFTSRSSKFNENKNREVTNIIDKSNLVSTFAPSPSKENKRTFKISSFYLLFASIIIIIGIIILIIYWKKRRLQPSSSMHRNKSKKQNILPTSASPESNDGDIATINSDSEASIV